MGSSRSRTISRQRHQSLPPFGQLHGAAPQQHQSLPSPGISTNVGQLIVSRSFRCIRCPAIVVHDGQQLQQQPALSLAQLPNGSKGRQRLQYGATIIGQFRKRPPPPQLPAAAVLSCQRSTPVRGAAAVYLSGVLPTPQRQPHRAAAVARRRQRTNKGLLKRAVAAQAASEERQ